MSWTIAWNDRALSDVERLSPQVRERVFAAVGRLAETERGNVKRLQGRDDELRLRVGDWRVRFELDHSAGVLRVLRVLPRGRAYRD